MSTPLFLLIGLALATCVIAYWSDNLGKKLGKKRVTLFGLRPRQTATLMTMTSSVVIMLFTFGVLLATNSGLRGALLRYDKEKADNRQLRASNQQLRSEQKLLQGEVKSAQQQASAAKNSASAAQKQYRQVHDKYGKALNDLNQKQEQLQGARSAERVARSSERQARAGEKTARNRAEKAGRDLQKKQGELGTVNQKLKLAQVDLKNLQGDLQKAQGRVREAQGNLKKVQGQLAQDRATYLREAEAFIIETGKLRAQIDERTQEIKLLQSQKEALDSDINQLKLLQIQLAQPSRGDIDVPEGAVYADRLIVPRLRAAQIAPQLRAMLAEGRDEVSKENSRRTIKLLLIRPSAELPQELPQEVIINSLAQFLEASRIPVSVRLSALRNHAKAETEIQCAFIVFQARLAFARDEVIARKVIDGGQSDAKIFNQLLHGLLNVGESEAIKRAVVPILRGDAKLYADGTNERLFEALRRVQAMGKPVEVRLLADDDLTTIDQLRVRFEIINPTTSSAKL
ncbi:MAG TPA: DUF3084 domain-containing protein [Abditibacteriaceae bacterium]|jgi:uncharacterized protein (DUF3084 family)